MKGLLSTSIASAITAAEPATAGGNEIDPHLYRHNHSFKGSLNL